MTDMYDLPTANGGNGSGATGSPNTNAAMEIDASNYSKPDPHSDSSEEFTLDAILVRIGQFGKFQLMVFVLICLPMLLNAIFSVTYVFTAATVVQRCNITECDTAQSSYEETWTQFSIPQSGNDLDQCNRYSSTLSGNGTSSEYDDEAICTAPNFHIDETESCPDNNFIYRDKEVTISNEFGISCSDQWMLSMVGTINNFGQFFGIPIGGFISDKYGRRNSLALGGFLSGIFGILRSFSPSYLVFIAFEFLDNLACGTLYSTCFILGIELVGPKKRVVACSLITIFYAIGEILLALVAKYYQNWRLILRIVYMPGFLLFAYFWILPESVRWLLSMNKEERAKNIIRRAARMNGRRLSDNTLDKVILVNRDKLLLASEGKFPIKEVFNNFFWRIANCSLCWIVNVLVYFGLSLNSVLLDGNKYNNFIFLCIVEIPGFLLPYLTMDRIGRRYSLFMFMYISGFCCLATIFTTDDQVLLKMAFFLVGKLTITASFQVLYFFTSEIFPTNLRNSMLSFCSMVGRVGSMLAPQTPLLAKYNDNAPALLFTVSALVSGALTLFFPETTNVVLPTTVMDASNIGVKKKKLEA